ncbi:MAG: glycerol-3-phosphate dehydrogenase [Pseudomonadota bacterium]|nr:glycerol-3-phosphate dehydrogenase [Pseudomonadota bacterium]
MYDIAIVGGGINGIGIANDAAGRGLKVLLVEQNDLASATSSWSSKLIHGGLRYLEHYEFRLVKEALAERDVLLKKAPHIIKPLEFVLPHNPSMRPTWMLKAGLWMYDHLNFNIHKKSALPRSHALNLTNWKQNPLLGQYTKGFSYSDCFVDDSRLVVLNAVQARDKGAIIKTYSQCTSAQANNDGTWSISYEDKSTGTTSTADAKVLVNAAGPWVQSFIEDKLQLESPRKIRLIKGSHIIVPKIHDGDEAFILQNDDNRIVFVIPYRGMSLVGTTDRPHKASPDTVEIDDFEVEYLLNTINQYFQVKRTRADIKFTYSGVRPLCDDESSDPSAVTRDYTLTLSADPAPILNIFGGKLTTYRKLSEAAMKKIEHLFPQAHGPWTAHAILPGGELQRDDLRASLKRQYAWLPDAMLERFVTSYGSLSFKILGEAKSLEDLGEHLFSTLYQAEIEYLKEDEFAQTAEDILWRRSKLCYELDGINKDEIIAKINSLLAQKVQIA